MVYSIVIPVYDEEAVLAETYARLVAVMEGAGEPFEIIFVNDGSRDRSPEILRDLSGWDRRVKVLNFSRNFGHQVAMTAGMDHAGGEAVVLMDADLQHPPELIPRMIAKWKEGCEVVFTVRDDKESYSPFMRFLMASFYSLLRRVSKLDIRYGQSDFRLMDRKVVDVFRTMREEDRFLRGLTEWVGFRQCGVTYQLEKRSAGRSKWSITKHIELAVDGIVGFSKAPLRIAMFCGVVTACLGFIEALRVVYLKAFCGIALTGWPELIVAVLFLGGLQLMTIGILGEYVGRIFEQGKGRPLYIVREALGFEDGTGAREARDGSR